VLRAEAAIIAFLIYSTPNRPVNIGGMALIAAGM